MKNLLCENFIKGLIETYNDDINSDLKINNRIILEVASKILDGSFNQYGEIIQIPKPNIETKNNILLHDGVKHIVDSILVVKLSSKTLILDAVEEGSFFDYLKVNKTMCYIEDSNIWFKNFKKDENLSKRVNDIGLLNLNSLIAELYSFKKNIIKEYINDIRDTEEYLNLTKSYIEEDIITNLDRELNYTTKALKLNEFDYSFKSIQDDCLSNITNKISANMKNLPNESGLIDMYIKDKESLRNLFYESACETNIKNIVIAFSEYEKYTYLVKKHSKYFELLDLLMKFNVKINSISNDIFNLSRDFKSGQLYINSSKTKISLSDIVVKTRSVDTIYKYSLNIYELFLQDYPLTPLLSRTDMHPFYITNRGKTIFKVSEETISELKSILNKLSENGFIL